MNVERVPVLYIAGSGRSGSTLLERILGQVEDFVPVGELKNLWLRNLESGDLCGCGNQVLNCEFWQEVFNIAYGGFDKVDFQEMRIIRNRVDRVRYLPRILIKSLKTNDFSKLLYEYLSILNRIYSAIHIVSGRKTIIDSSKDISLLALLSQIPNINLNILHLIRDSRGVAFSWSKRKKFKPEVTSRNAYLTTENPIKIAIDWDVRNVFVENYKNNIQSYKRLCYESLIDNPTESISQVLKPLNISSDLEFISSHSVDLHKDHHTIAGNPVRFQKGRIELQIDNEWRNKMKKADRTVVTFTTWILLKRYRYI